MSRIPNDRQNLADRLSNALRRFEREDGDIGKLASSIGHERRDLTRWSQGTAMPAEVLCALLDELPRHLADHLIGMTGLRLVSKETPNDVNVLRAAAATSGFSHDVANRMADKEWCHRDEAAAKEHAQRVIAELQTVAGE